MKELGTEVGGGHARGRNGDSFSERGRSIIVAMNTNSSYDILRRWSLGADVLLSNTQHFHQTSLMIFQDAAIDPSRESSSHCRT